MAISTFNEVSGLSFCFNFHDLANVGVTGDVLDYIDASEGDEPFRLTAEPDGTSHFKHGPAYMMDQMRCAYPFKGDGQNPYVFGTMPTILTPGDAWTWIVCQARSQDDINDASIGMLRVGDSSASDETSLSRGGDGAHKVMINRISTDMQPIVVSQAETFVVETSGTANDPRVWISGVSQTVDPITAQTNDLSGIRLGGYRPWETGTTFIMLYRKVLSDTERGDVEDLIDYWMANGEGPAAGPAGQFTITVDKPGAAGLAFQWEESSDNTNWQNVGTILTDTAGATTDTLLINSATVAMHNTYVRCQVTTTDDGFDTSDSAQLFIEGQ